MRSPEGARVELEGAPIDLVRTGNLCAAVLAHPARGPECVAFLLGSPLVQVRLPTAPRAPITASDGVAACAGDGCVHVFREVDGRVSSVTVPIPPAQRTDIALVAGRLCVIAVNQLVIIELTALPWGAAQRAVALDLVGVRWPGERLAEPARVVAAMPKSIAVNHPKLGRLTLSVLPGSPALVRGGEVMIDDVREELPGIHKVYAWRAGSAAPCVTPLPEKIALAAPVLPAIDPAPLATPVQAPANAAPSRGAAARVTALAERHGFVVSPLLVRVLEARERDPVLARWLDLLGLELGGPESMVEDWDADPSLLELSQRGNGDAHCLYIYPPWCREGREPPVVTFCHETNYLDFEALSFADFLERRLADTHADARVVALVRERLSLPPRAVAPGRRRRGCLSTRAGRGRSWRRAISGWRWSAAVMCWARSGRRSMPISPRAKSTRRRGRSCGECMRRWGGGLRWRTSSGLAGRGDKPTSSGPEVGQVFLTGGATAPESFSATRAVAPCSAQARRRAPSGTSSRSCSRSRSRDRWRRSARSRRARAAGAPE